MICADCGIKNRKNKPNGGVWTFSVYTCDWCGEDKGCVQEFKYGLEPKQQPKDKT